MCNVFGMAADERSSEAIECELAPGARVLTSLCTIMVWLNRSKVQHQPTESEIELREARVKL
jgi:hypothetical protein